MSDLDNNEQSSVSRRTVTKAMAWAVPAIAVAATVPIASASAPSVSFDWANGCATVGNGDGGCTGEQKAGQVPVTIHNSSAGPLVFQFVSVQSKNSNSNTWSSVFGLWTNNGTQDKCGPQITTLGCGNYVSVTVAAGATLHLWLVGESLQSSGAFDMSLSYRWIQPCMVPGGSVSIVSGPTPAGQTNIAPSNNCAGASVPIS